ARPAIAAILGRRAWKVNMRFAPVYNAAGHNALRGSGPGQNFAFDDAVADAGWTSFRSAGDSANLSDRRASSAFPEQLLFCEFVPMRGGPLCPPPLVPDQPTIDWLTRKLGIGTSVHTETSDQSLRHGCIVQLAEKLLEAFQCRKITFRSLV